MAFRLARHNLSRRLPADEWLKAATACGIQNTPPGSAELAFLARVADFTPEAFNRAIKIDKTLLQMWTMRISPHYFPTRDLAVFTSGLLPLDEVAIRFAIQNFVPDLDRAGISATEAYQLTTKAMTEALDGKRLTKGELSSAAGKLLSPDLLRWCAGCKSNHIPESLFRLTALSGLFGFYPGENNQTTFIRIEEWLGAAHPETDPVEAARELARRYLGCYAPSTAKHFAEWAGISPAQAQTTWEGIAEELQEIDFAGKKPGCGGPIKLALSRRRLQVECVFCRPTMFICNCVTA